jgi:hypothetical protein
MKEIEIANILNLMAAANSLLKTKKTPKESDEDKIVFIHNFKNVIMVKRTKGGVWNINYNVRSIIDYLNKQCGKNYSYTNTYDLFDAGLDLGYLSNNLLKKCKILYGDEKENINQQ